MSLYFYLIKNSKVEFQIYGIHHQLPLILFISFLFFSLLTHLQYTTNNQAPSIFVKKQNNNEEDR